MLVGLKGKIFLGLLSRRRDGGFLRIRAMLALALALALAPRPAAAATLWLTRFDGAAPLARRELPATETSCATDTRAAVVAVDPASVAQPVDGFGAALTESAALVLDALPKAERERALAELFGPDGVRFSMLRVPIGASDFSRSDYSCDDPPSGADPALKSFSLSRCAGPMLTYLRKIRRINPALRLVGSPWSAPAWMTSNGTMENGTLKPEYEDAYARYLVRFAAEMKRAGAPLAYLTPLNEPVLHERVESYPSMTMTEDQQARLISRFLGPTLKKNGFSDLKVLGFDHNWSSAVYASALLSDPSASKYLAGVAFHCYSGEPGMMAPIAAAHPDKEIHFTECAAGDWEKRFAQAFGWSVENLIIGNLANGARSVMMWNLALDEKGGPTNHGCLDCRGVITVNRSSGTYERSPEFYALAHGSLAADRGARVAASKLSGDSDGLREVSLSNPDGTLAVIALNLSDRARRVQLRAGPSCLAYDQPAGSAVTLRWKAAP